MNFKSLTSPSIFATFAVGVAAFCLVPLAGCGSGGGGNNGGTPGVGLTVSKTFYPLTDASGAALSWTYDTTSVARSRAAQPQHVRHSLRASLSRAAAGGSFTVSYQGTTTFNGQTVEKFSAYGGTRVSYVDLSDAGVAYVGGQLNGVATPLWGNDWYVRFALSPGQTEDFTSAVGNAAGSLHYTITRLADQSVTTPAGTFTCAVYKRTTLGVTGVATDDYSVGDVDTYWFAKQIGLVKDTFAYSDGYTDTDILRSYGAPTTTLPVPAPSGAAPNPAGSH